MSHINRRSFFFNKHIKHVQKYEYFDQFYRVEKSDFPDLSNSNSKSNYTLFTQFFSIKLNIFLCSEKWALSIYSLAIVQVNWTRAFNGDCCIQWSWLREWVIAQLTTCCSAGYLYNGPMGSSQSLRRYRFERKKKKTCFYCPLSKQNGWHCSMNLLRLRFRCCNTC